MKTKKILVASLILALLIAVFCISSYAATTIRGDFDDTPGVNIDDAIYLMMHTIFPEDYPLDEGTADFDGTPGVDIDDAIYLMMHTIFPEDYSITPIHKLTHYDAHDATCTEAGNVEYWSCSDCGKSFSDSNGVKELASVVVPAGHNWRSATCSAPKTCKLCYATEGVPTDHVYDQTIVNASTQKTAASCTAAATYYKSCSCGRVSTDATHVFENGSKKAHSYELANTVAASCTADGSKTYKCSGCSDEYTEKTEAKLGHNLVNPTEIAVAGSTCEYIVRSSCSREGCNATVDQSEHVYHHNNYVASITIAATCTTDGVKTLTCPDCGAQETEKIEKDEKNKHQWQNGTVSANVRTDTCSVCSETRNVTVYTGTSTGITNANDLADKEIEVNGANISLDEGVVDALEGKDVTLTAGKLEGDDRNSLGLSNEQLAQVGDSPIYDFTIENESGLVSQFGEDNYVTITLPYTLKEGEDVDSIAIWFITDEVQSIKATYNNGYVTFKTNHFSYYTVTLLTPAQRCDLYGHIFATYTQAPTCTAGGYDLCVCVRCNHSEQQKPTDPLGHDYQVTTNNATCTENGSENYACKNCEHRYSTILPATGHDWSVADKKDSTCAENGYIKYACKNCDAEYVEILEKLDHEFTDTVVPPTCETEGSTLRACKNCDYGIFTKQAALGHDKVNHDAKAPTCTEKGWDAYVACSRCDYTTKVEKNALGHSYKWIVDREPTFDAKGVKHEECEKCHDKKNENTEIPVKKCEHSLTKIGAKAATCLDNGNKEYYSCSICKKCYSDASGVLETTVEDNVLPALGHDKENHSAKAPTCTEKGWDAYEICKRCDYTTKVEKNALGHDKENHSAKAPTCTEKGWDAYEICKRCDYTTKVEKNALGHDKVNHSAKAPTCTKIGWNAYETCKRCDYITYQEIPKIDHEYTNDTITKQPTCSSQGEMVATCVCGDTKITLLPTNDVHDFENGVCTDCGAIEVDTYYVNLVNSWKNIDGFAIKIENFSFEIKEQDTSIVEAFKLIGSIKQVDIAELELFVEDGEIGGAATGTVVIFNGPISNGDAVYSFKAVIHEGFVYISVAYGLDVENVNDTYYIKMSVDAILENISDSMGLSSSGFQMFGGTMSIILSAVDTLIDLNQENANEILKNAFNIFFSFEVQEDGSYLATLDYAKLYALNENLASKSVAEVIDIYFGEGSFDSIIDLIIEILEIKFTDIDDYLDDIGLDSEEIFDKINNLINSSGVSNDYDIRDYFDDEEYADYTMGMALFSYRDNSYLDDFNKYLVDVMRTESLYEMMNSNSVDYVKDTIDALLDQICDVISISFATDAEGMLTDINIDVDEFVCDYRENDMYLSFNLNININGRIEVTWMDIVEEIDAAIAPPSDEELDAEIDYDVSNYYSGNVTYKGKEYYYSYGFEVYGKETIRDEMTGIVMQKDCGDWMWYNAVFAAKRIEFRVATIKVDGRNVYLIINRFNNEVVEIVPSGVDRFTAIYEDGSEKEIAFDHSKYESGYEVYIYLCTQVFDDPDGEIDLFGSSFYYSYNAELDEYSDEYHHNIKYEYKKLGEECKDGINIHSSCENCGISADYTVYDCPIQERITDLQELGLCGGVIQEYYCPVCEDVKHFWVYGSYCDWEYVGRDDNGYAIYECSVCDTTKITSSSYGLIVQPMTYEAVTTYEGDYIVPIDPDYVVDSGFDYVVPALPGTVVEKDENCQYTTNHVLIYIVGDEEVYRREYTTTNTSHRYGDYEYELQGDRCSDGLIEYRACQDCGYRSVYDVRYECSYRWENTTNLVDLGMCGGYIREYKCYRCGDTNGTDISLYNCQFEFVEENDDGYSVYECINCGATKLEYIHATEKDEDCRYDYTEIIIWLMNDVELHREERSYTSSDHKSAYRYELLGETCEDGYREIEYCEDCGRVWNYGIYYGHRTEHVVIDFSEFGICAGSGYFVQCEVCNEIVGIGSLHPECALGDVIEEEITDKDGEAIGVSYKYVCSVCGCTFESRQWIETLDSCSSYECSSISIYTADENIATQLIKDLRVSHEYEYDYDLIGDSCNDWYYVTKTCSKCGDVYGEWDIGHKTEETTIPLSDFGMCGGYIENYVCTVCNEVMDSYINDDYCHWGYEGVNADGYMLYRCRDCDAVRLVSVVQSEKDEACNYTVTTTYIYMMGDEQVYSSSGSYTSTAHDYQYEFEMKGSSCEDGYRVIITCADCNYRTYRYSSSHSTYELFEADAEQIGGCPTHYFIHRGCPCNYDSEVVFDLENMIYDEVIGAYVCTECGFTVKDTYGETTDGCNLIITTSQSVSIGDTSIYANSASRIRVDHSFEYTVVLGDDETYTLSLVCKNCNESFSDDCGVVYSGTAYVENGYYEYLFVPETSDTYVITSHSDYDTCVDLYHVSSNGAMSILASNDDGGENGNFKLAYNLTVGETYAYRIRFYSNSNNGEIPFTLSIELNIDGNEECKEHRHEYAYVLPEGVASCEDGILEIYVCPCGNVSDTAFRYEHKTTTERIYLSEYGACGGQVRHTTCPCGQSERINFYSTHGIRTTNTYVDDNGETIYVTNFACSSCKLRYTESYYLKNNGDCTESRYYTVTVSVDTQLVLNESYVSTYEKHNTVETAELREGATNCYDGVIVTRQCQDCEYKEQETYWSHYGVVLESFAVKENGGSCDGEVQIIGCACGERVYCNINNVLCDMYESSTDMWIDDYIYGEHYTVNGYEWFDYDAYEYSCAVTDPELCGFVVRYAEYWKKSEGCTATRYLTVQIGYDEAEGTCIAERTYALNVTTTYHDYVHENVDNGDIYTCSDCGSYYSCIYTYENGQPVKTEYTWVNALDDGNSKRSYELYEYENGDETKHRYEVTHADGSEYWEQWEYANEEYSIDPFGEGSWYRKEAYSNSNGRKYNYERAWTLYYGRELELLHVREEDGYWDKYEYEYSFENGCVRTTKYTNSKDESNVSEESICWWYGYNSNYLKLSTCTQYGVAQLICCMCETPAEEYITSPTGHNWVLLPEGIYQCYDCGLQGLGGADGTVVMEDLTEQYGNGENYVVGYWDREEIKFSHYVTLMLHEPGEDGDDQIVLFSELDFHFETDPYVGVWVSKAQVQAAAEARGYTSDQYDVRISFVPTGSDGSFDYAITFGDLNAGNDDIVISSDCYIIKPLAEGMAYQFQIVPEEDGTWVITLDDLNGDHGYEMSIADQGVSTYGTHSIEVYLNAGEPYTLYINCYGSDFYSDNRVGISFNKI